MTTIVAGVIGALVGFVLFVRWGERWGSTPRERALTLPGDEWLDGGPPRRVCMTRAVWVEAPAADVWPWIAQMGRGAGWYSYDRLDNGGRRSACHLVSWIPEPRLGDAAPIGYLRHLAPGEELVWWLKGGSFFGAHLRGLMLYRVVRDGPRTRLVVRMRADAQGRLAGLACWTYRCVDSIMARRQPLGIKERAERFGARTEDPGRPETGARDQFQLYQAIYADGTVVGDARRADAAVWRRAALEDGLLDASAPAGPVAPGT